MYMYAMVRPFTAGVIGLIELALMAAYPFLFGYDVKKLGPGLPLSTIPRYMLNEYMAMASIMALFGFVRTSA